MPPTVPQAIIVNSILDDSGGQLSNQKANEKKDKQRKESNVANKARIPRQEYTDLTCEQCWNGFTQSFAFILSCCGKSICKSCAGDVIFKKACLLCYTPMKDKKCKILPNPAVIELLRLLNKQKQMHQDYYLATGDPIAFAQSF